MPSPIRILLVSRHRILQETLTTSLAEAPRDPAIEIVEWAADVPEALARLPQLEVEIALLDRGLDPSPRYPRTRRLREARSGLGVVLFGIETEDDAVDAFEAGAFGALPRNATLADLRRTLEAAVAGDVACSQEVQQRLRERLIVYERRDDAAVFELEEPLTPREAEILQLLHLKNREIGERLYIAEATVKIHVHHILKKFRTHKRRVVIRLARGIGLLDAGG